MKSAFCSAAIMLAMAMPASLRAQDNIAVSKGDCSPTLIFIIFSGNLQLNCDKYKDALTDLVESVDKLGRQRKYSPVERQNIADGLNAILSEFYGAVQEVAEARKRRAPLSEERKTVLAMQIATVFDGVLNASSGDSRAFKKLANEWKDRYQKLIRDLNGSSDDDVRVKNAIASRSSPEKLLSILNDLVNKREGRVEVKALRNFELATVYQLLYQPDKATPHFKRAYELQPSAFEFAFAYANEQFKAGNYAVALPLYRRAQSNYNAMPAPQRPGLDTLIQLRIAMGWTQLSLNHYDQAVEILQKVNETLNSEQNPSLTSILRRSSTLMLLASASSSMGDEKLAYAQYAQANDLLSRHLEEDFGEFQPILRRVLLGQALMEETAGRPKQAELRLQRALALENRARMEIGKTTTAGYAEVLHHLGLNMAAAGRFPEAVAFARDAVSAYRYLRGAGAETRYMQELAQSLSLQAQCLMKINASNGPEAESLLVEAITLVQDDQTIIAKGVGMGVEMVVLALDMVEVYLAQSKNAIAQQLTEIALPTFRVMHDSYETSGYDGLTRALHLGGKAAAAASMPDLARKRYEEAISLAKNTNKTLLNAFTKKKFIELYRDASSFYDAQKRSDLSAPLLTAMEELAQE